MANEAKHTPGPWNVKKALHPVDGEYDFAIMAGGDKNWVIAEAWGCVDPVRGEAVNTSRLVEADIPVVRNRFLSGETKTTIAASYGISRQAIGHIVNGRNWKHV